MKKYKILLRASIRRKKVKLFSIFIMMFIAVLCMGTGITVWHSGDQTIEKEMNRLGYGDFTIWIQGEIGNLKEKIENVSGVDSVKIQPLIYASYEINGGYSDNEGQLLNINQAVPYDFILEDGTKISVQNIESGTIYVSPALKSSFDFKVGDVITFDLARSQGKKDFTIAGFFADGFMGSSMIDMKSFLIAEDDYKNLENFLKNTSRLDRLGKIGAMIHVSGNSINKISNQEILRHINEETDVSLQTEFSYQKDSIKSYMLLLQNILCGFLLAFSFILLVITMVVVSKSIRDDIEEERKDIAILKSMGLSSVALMNMYDFVYLGTITMGCIIGAFFVYPLSILVARGMVTSIGLKVHIDLLIGNIVIIIVSCIFIFVFFTSLKMIKLLKISPMETIRSKESLICNAKIKIKGKHISLGMAIREIEVKKKSYIGICIIGAILVFFLSIVGKMGKWLGPNGEGLMNTFSVADHDIGIQPYNRDVPMDEIERIIDWYSPIKEKYELAMQDVNIDGLAVTANVLNDNSFFHVLEGKVCEGNEILITETIAKELKLGIDDVVTIIGSGRRADYRISGIYQCANGMGMNIGMDLSGYSQIGDTSGFIWCYHYILENGTVRDYVMNYLQDNYESIDVHTNSWSGLKGIVKMMQGLMLMLYAIAALFVLITVKLTAENLLRLENFNMAVYKSMGMSNGVLQKAFVFRFIIVVFAGTMVSIVAAESTADIFIRKIFQNFGIADFSSKMSLQGTVLPVVLVVLMFSIFAWMMSSQIKRISIVKILNENDE